MSRSGGGPFDTTQWSLVLAAGDADHPERATALETLCRDYWFPAYAFVRRRGWAAEDARDLTQGFFALVIEKNTLARARRDRGRFRSFLLTALRNYLANEWDRARARKRGGDRVPISVDAAEAERRMTEDVCATSDPQLVFEQRWARELLERSLRRLELEADGAGDGGRKRRLLGLLTDAGESYRQVADDLAVSESAVKVAVHRLRRRYGEVLREEVGRTVDRRDRVDDELRHLFACLDR